MISIFDAGTGNDQVLIGASYLRNKMVSIDLDHRTIRILTGVDCKFTELVPPFILIHFSPITTVISYLILIGILAFCFAGKDIMNWIKDSLKKKKKP